jgi:hypothetical protein
VVLKLKAEAESMMKKRPERKNKKVLDGSEKAG